MLDLSRSNQVNYLDNQSSLLLSGHRTASLMFQPCNAFLIISAHSETVFEILGLY